MRSPLLASFLLALALALPAVAAAGPKPIKKPDAPAATATPPAKKATPHVKAPVAATHTTQPPPSSSSRSSSSSSSSTSRNTTPITKPSSTGTSGTGSSSATTQVGGSTTVTPKIVSVNVVGRDQSGAEITIPADVTPTVAAPDPTPLALVSVGDRIRSHSTATPAWMLALLAVLAAAEAFLVVRLVRNRSRGGGGISTAS